MICYGRVYNGFFNVIKKFCGYLSFGVKIRIFNVLISKELSFN